MYSPPYDEDVIAGQMGAVFLGSISGTPRTPQRPNTLIGAPKSSMDMSPGQASLHDHYPRHHSEEFLDRDHVISRLPETHLLADTSHLMMTSYQKRARLQSGMFNRLPDSLALRIFSFLETPDLLHCSQVCKRFSNLCWNHPDNWRTIHLKGEGRGDKLLRVIFRRLLSGPVLDPSLCFVFIEKVLASSGCQLTDKSLGALSRRCPELTHLQVHNSNEIFDSGVAEILNRTNLQHLDLTGCLQVANLFGNNEILQRRFQLQYLDLTDCLSIDDCSLQGIVRFCPSLVYLYLRRCVQITDAGLKDIAYCSSLKEISISDCRNISDYSLYELAKLGAQLRYLSVAKCNLVTDAGLKMIARRAYKLRYINTRCCDAISDESIMSVARCCPRLRAIDIGACDISDTALKVLAESCPNLKKLSLRNCNRISDNGLNYVAYYCRGLQYLNIQDCHQISSQGYRYVKMYCKSLNVIEHTNPGFG